MKKEEIIEKLDEIQALKFSIEQRIWNGSTEVTDVDGTVLSEENIQARIGLLAKALKENHPDDHPVLVAIMDGALPFSADLNAALSKEGYAFQPTAMQASSYGNETSSGNLKIGAAPKISLGGRTVIIVDEVCDTGKTCAALTALFLKQGAKQVKTMVLVDKDQKRDVEFKPDFVGFTIDPNAFIIGMGLDYRNLLRNTRSIRAVDITTLPNEEEKALLDCEEILNEMLVEQTLSSNLETFSLFAAYPEGQTNTPVVKRLS